MSQWAHDKCPFSLHEKRRSPMSSNPCLQELNWSPLHIRRFFSVALDRVVIPFFNFLSTCHMHPMIYTVKSKVSVAHQMSQYCNSAWCPYWDILVSCGQFNFYSVFLLIFWPSFTAKTTSTFIWLIWLYLQIEWQRTCRILTALVTYACSFSS